MNGLLFCALIIALIYYFFIHLKKKQTSPALPSLLDQLQNQIQELQNDDQLNQQTILSLQAEVATKEQELEELKANNSAQQELTEAESIITQLITNLKQLNQSLK